MSVLKSADIRWKWMPAFFRGMIFLIRYDIIGLDLFFNDFQCVLDDCLRTCLQKRLYYGSVTPIILSASIYILPRVVLSKFIYLDLELAT